MVFRYRQGSSPSYLFTMHGLVLHVRTDKIDHQNDNIINEVTIYSESYNEVQTGMQVTEVINLLWHISGVAHYGRNMPFKGTSTLQQSGVHEEAVRVWLSVCIPLLYIHVGY